MRENVGGLVAVLAVARAGSFTRAAREMGVSQPALSHTVRELEARLGVRLLNRTTRSVSTTEAGERLLQAIAPHFDGIEAGLAALTEVRDKPAGTVRITVGDTPAESIVLPVVARLLPAYPDLRVEISVNAGFVDIVAERFDAGVRLGETVAKDMVATRIGPDMRMAIVGSPGYFADHPAPATPHDLSDHNCINLRYTATSGWAVWEFEKAGVSLDVRVEGQLMVNSNALARMAALEGAGLAYLPAEYVRSFVASGALVSVIEDWCDPFPGYFLYYPSRRQPSTAFRLVVEALRHRG